VKWMKDFLTSYGKQLLFIILTVVLAGLLAYLGFLITKTTTDLEKILIQFLQLIVTIAITYFPTKAIASKQERDLVQSRARMAIRRTATLDLQMRQVARHISEHESRLEDSIDGNRRIPANTAIDGIQSIKGMHAMQFYQISAALEDWTEVLPKGEAAQGKSGEK